ncbi:MAG: T9SS type A sorting domain-containing protein [Taibaiella sp.]|jgi:hypothetical protein
MKKLFLYSVYLIILSQTVTAQNIVNGNFSVNNWNDGFQCGIWNTFSDFTVQNWVRSHGTPNFQIPSEGAPSNNNIVLWTGGIGSEGILGGYEFKKSQAYCVKVNLASWTLNGLTTDRFYVYACSGLIRNLILDGDCTSVMPSLPPGAELIGIGSKQTNNYFPFIPTTNNNQLFIVFPSGEGDWDWIAISEVVVTSFCRQSLIFDNGQIPPAAYSAAYIYAGTSAGTGSITVTNDPNAQTKLTGSSKVILQPNFVATASNNGSFTANIAPCPSLQCGNVIPRPAQESNNYDPISDQKSRLLFQSLKEKNKPFAAKNVLIAPNPNNGNFIVKYPENTDSEIKIVNLLGTVIYQTNLKNERAKEIELSTKVVSGTYIIQITGKDFNLTERIVIIK